MCGTCLRFHGRSKVFGWKLCCCVSHAEFRPNGHTKGTRFKSTLHIFLLESPHHGGDEPPSGFFNLTWTYRRDSDIYSTFYLDKFHPTVWTDLNVTREFLKKKRNRAVMFSSNCRTPGGRERYVEKLQRHFPVDIIGECGQYICPRNLSDDSCKYSPELFKFYLSFENSYCLDYVTEKMIRPLNAGTVPVVFGAAHYAKLLPPESFIHTTNFASLKTLADFLWALVHNFGQYAEYFNWRYNGTDLQLPVFTDHSATDGCKLVKCFTTVLTEYDSTTSTTFMTDERLKRIVLQ